MNDEAVPGVWIIFCGLQVEVVEDCWSRRQAVTEVLDRYGLGAKRYLARDWTVRQATKPELARYAGHVSGKSKPPPKTKAKPRKTIQERLGL